MSPRQDKHRALGYSTGDSLNLQELIAVCEWHTDNLFLGEKLLRRDFIQGQFPGMIGYRI